jgi:hypothetical protein
VIDDLFISAYNTDPPSDEDAGEGLKILQKMDLSRARMLVVTAGGAPTATQRKKVYDVLNGQEPPAAIVSDSMVVRTIVTAMNWFNRKNRVFSLSELDAALTYLQIPTFQFEMFRREIAKLQAEISRSNPKRAAG